MEPPTAHHAGLPPSSLSLTQQAVNAVRGAPPMSPPQHVVPNCGNPPPLIRSVSPPMTQSISPKPEPQTQNIIEASPGRNGDIGPDEELLLKWDDHHKSFFELAEDLCHQELFIDVTLSCGEHNFPAHKLVLSVCSPYFRHLFLRNPCKHPIVVLKDVHFKYMKLLLMYMYRGEVSCPQEDLHGLLKTARSLQIRGLVELERKREAEGYLQNSVTGSPIKRIHPDRDHIAQGDGASTTSCDIGPHSGDEFSLDEVRHRLHGQLDIQPISQQPQSSTHGIHPNTTWYNRDNEGQDTTPPPQAHTTTGGKGSSSGTGSDGGGAHSEEDATGRHQIVRHPHQRLKNDPPNGQRSPHNHWADNNGGVNHHHNRASPITGNSVPHDNYRQGPPPPDTRGRSPRGGGRPPQSTSANNAAILAAAQAAGMPMSALDPADPMSSMNALLAAAQAHGKKSPLPISSTLASLLPPNLTAPSATSTSGSRTDTTGSHPPGSRPPPGGPPGNGTAPSGNGDLSNAATMANLQLYYYMQKVASAGMGNPKERKECPICGKTLYDRSTWNRHMRIHTGEKPYPCQFCGRRFRTNYNKLGHEKKCPDRHAAAHDLTPASNSNAQNNVNSSSNNKNDHSNSGEPPQKIMLNLNNQAVPVSSGAGGGRPTNHSGSQSSAPPTAQTAEYR